MAVSKSLLFTVLPLVLAFLLHQPGTAMSADVIEADDFFLMDDELVHNMCDKTPHYNLCTSTINTDARADLKSSPKGLLAILLNRALENAGNTYAYIEVLREKALHSKTRDVLHKCSETYHEAVGSLKAALGMLESKDYAKLHVIVNSASSDLMACEGDDHEEQRPLLLPALANRTKYISQLSSIALAINNLIQHNPVGSSY